MIRLHVLIASRGVASRRKAEALIAAGRVTVNGLATTRPGITVDPLKDKVAIDGHCLPPPTCSRTLMLYKPCGLVCSHNRRQGPSVFDLVNESNDKWICVGRLDKDSEGLLLLTTDGQLANQLMHPRYGHRKRYHAYVQGRVSSAAMKRLSQPIEIDGRLTQPAKVARVASLSDRRQTVLQIELIEGRNRQIRRLCEAAGLSLQRLIRIGYGGLTLDRLSPGTWRDLTPEELDALKRAS